MILVSAGHHPARKGANYNGFYEHDEALLWVAEILSHLDSLAEMVPVGTLRSKIDYINEHNAELAVEIHFNQTPDGMPSSRPKWQGALTLHAGSHRGEQLADNVQKELEQVFGRHWRGTMIGYYQMNKNKGLDAFLEKTNCPAVIIEPEFIFRKEIIQSARVEACSAISLALLKTIEEFK